MQAAAAGGKGERYGVAQTEVAGHGRLDGQGLLLWSPGGSARFSSATVGDSGIGVGRLLASGLLGSSDVQRGTETGSGVNEDSATPRA